MYRIIFILSLIYNLSWGCLACSYGDIKILTHLYLNVKKNTLQSVDVEWTLDPIFSQMVLGDYDTNRNGIFDSKERNEVHKAILSMKDVGFFIRPNINGKNILLKELKNFSVVYAKGLVIYRFTIPINTSISPSSHLRIRYDAEAAYNNAIVFHLNEKNIFINPPKNALFTAKLTQLKNPRTNDQILDITLRPRIVALASPMSSSSVNHESGFTQSLHTLSEKIHGALVEAKDAPTIKTIGTILLFSLLYGILHAAGPGHGKTLVASYFSANERSYSRALAIALLIALTHVISALILSLVLYWFIHTMFSQTMQHVALYTTKLSGLIILSISLYLARQKWLYYRPKRVVMTFSTSAPHRSSCGCHSCKTAADSTDLGLILGAGIVPCPGTVIVFLFTISMGMIGLGVISAIVMSLGMGITIALSAALGTAVRQKSSNMGDRSLKMVDIIGVGLMMMAGIILITV